MTGPRTVNQALNPAGPSTGTVMHRRHLLRAGATFTLASLVIPHHTGAEDIPSPEVWVGRSFWARSGPVTQALTTAWHYANPVSAEGHIIRLVETWTTPSANHDVSIVDVEPVPYIHEYTGDLVSWIEVEGSDAVEWQHVGGAFLHVTEPGIVWAARVSGSGSITEQADWIMDLAARFLDREITSPLETGKRSGGLWDLLPATDDLTGTFIMETEAHHGVATNEEGTPVPAVAP